ncbi:MAG: GNAT family N-acetyltransferase [Candidatus Methanofastidiosia archaeon]
MSFKFLPIDRKTLKFQLQLCLEYHPSGKKPSQLKKGFEAKKKWMEEVFEELEPCGFVLLDNKKPCGMIEFLPQEMAKKCGYIVGEERKNTLTVTCVEVSKAYTNEKNYKKGLMFEGEKRAEIKKLLVRKCIEYLRGEKKYERIEVGAFKGNGDWNPAWLFEKLGFRKIEDRGRLQIMELRIE